MFRSYNHLQVEIYLLEFIRLTTDSLFLEYIGNIMDYYSDRFDSWLLY
jgi:hypothetical protein